ISFGYTDDNGWYNFSLAEGHYYIHSAFGGMESGEWIWLVGDRTVHNVLGCSPQVLMRGGQPSGVAYFFSKNS
ncbi:MAG: hypothetical protein PHU95_05460, partial [Candidatus Thermoplasmatota archaeon]|nr:hypothetical protein [Candidatus Thermoplasmatota archaeon]